MTRIIACAASLLLAHTAAAQYVLNAVRAGGEVLRIDPTSGAVVVIGGGGVPVAAAGGEYFSASSAQPDQILQFNPCTGSSRLYTSTTGRPPGHSIRALATAGYESLHVLLDGPTEDVLAILNLSTGQYSQFRATGRSDLAALAVSPGATLYSLTQGGLLCQLGPTGEATVLGETGIADGSLAFTPEGRLLGAGGANLYEINPVTGAATLIGPTGVADIRGLTAGLGCYEGQNTTTFCYADCDLSNPPPRLNVNDFICFMTVYSIGLPYANCDGSTTPPMLNVNDFICFQARWAGAVGCW